MNTNGFTRKAQLNQLGARQGRWDMVVIGGGATGLGVALDGASRGYSVVLFEQYDFGKGTSSRSTKLIHGGVRYLQQGNIGLVREALHERGLLCANAPHLVHPLPTILPLYKWWEPTYYWLGLKGYDALAGGLGLGASSFLTAEETVGELPTVRRAGLRGGVRYFDANFDDTRLLVDLAQAAVAHGAICLNYFRVDALRHRDGTVCGVRAIDTETDNVVELEAAVVINAGGPFSDHVRALDNPERKQWIVPSQGVHIVLDREFLSSDSALIVPRTSDGRVIFAIPWHGHTLVGTTDTPLNDVTLEPQAHRSEIEFLLKTVSEYLDRRPTWSDIRATFAGIRPLVRADHSEKTSKLARDHEVRVSKSGLVSIVGGKWTTYRRMAEDCVDLASQVGGLAAAPCLTEKIPLGDANSSLGARHQSLSIYGSAAQDVARLVESQPGYSERLHARHPYVKGEVVWATRHEMARTVEDVLARRLRLLFLDVAAAVEVAPGVAEAMATELGYDLSWQEQQLQQFEKTAAVYRADGVSNTADS